MRKPSPSIWWCTFVCAVAVGAGAGVSAAPADVNAVPPPSVDRSTPEMGLKALIDAIERDDVEQVMGSIALPPGVDLTQEDRRAYGLSVIACSKLRWAVQEKFGWDAGRRLAVRVDLPSVPRVDGKTLAWRTLGASGVLKEHGALSSALGRGVAPNAISISMVQSADGQWRLNKVSQIAALVVLQVEDAPWQEARTKRALAELEAGKYATDRAVADALVPHAPASRPTSLPLDRSTPEGAVSVLARAIEAGDVAAAAAGLVRGRSPLNDPLPRVWAGEAVAALKLKRAIEGKFDAVQARRIIDDAGLAKDPLRDHRRAAWVVNEDVARAAFEPAERYRPEFRMVRSGGVWRIWLPPRDRANDARAAARGEATYEQRKIERTKLWAEVLASIDTYKTPGALLEVLDPARRELKSVARDSQKQIQAQLDQLRREQMARPPATPREARSRGIEQTFLQLAAAMAKGSAEDAASFYAAAGAGGDRYGLDA